MIGGSFLHTVQVHVTGIENLERRLKAELGAAVISAVSKQMQASMPDVPNTMSMASSAVASPLALNK